jgi:23S rRNA pseudouridine1911/1915/1917 synthase
MIFEVQEKDTGLRLDQFLARCMPDTSRARLQESIRSGEVRVNGAPGKPSQRLRAGERIELVRPAPPPAPLRRAFAEDIPLQILYEDDLLAAVNKPAGMTVHAGAGASRGTLVNALLYNLERLSGVGGPLRPGIVHRLDRLTSGVLLVAKTDAAHRYLAEQFSRRQVRKTYLALVHARQPPKAGREVLIERRAWRRLEMPIRRDRRRRVRMTARAREGRAAVTDFRVLEQFPGFAWLELRIHTGRTHQIRVHLSTAGHPVVGDTLYGAPSQPALRRVFLHARMIVCPHPATGRELTVRAPLPPELEMHLARLRAGNSDLVLL